MEEIKEKMKKEETEEEEDKEGKVQEKERKKETQVSEISGNGKLVGSKGGCLLWGLIEQTSSFLATREILQFSFAATNQSSVPSLTWSRNSGKRKSRETCRKRRRKKRKIEGPRKRGRAGTGKGVDLQISKIRPSCYSCSQLRCPTHYLGDQVRVSSGYLSLPS